MDIKFSVMTLTGFEFFHIDCNRLGGPGTSTEEMRANAEKIYKQLNPNTTVIAFDTYENMLKDMLDR